VGSKVWLNIAEDYYILGLWLADGYWRSSSIGLSSSDSRLIGRFRTFLRRIAPNSSLKKRIYQPIIGQKRKKIAEHLYVNNRPLTRLFMSYKEKNFLVPDRFLPAYLAGRIDGDGSVDNKHRSGIRIAYGSKSDAERDLGILGRDNVSLYYYKAANTWVIYLRKNFCDKILAQVQKYSVKLLPRRD